MNIKEFKVEIQKIDDYIENVKAFRVWAKNRYIEYLKNYELKLQDGLRFYPTVQAFNVSEDATNFNY